MQGILKIQAPNNVNYDACIPKQIQKLVHIQGMKKKTHFTDEIKYIYTFLYIYIKTQHIHIYIWGKVEVCEHISH